MGPHDVVLSSFLKMLYNVWFPHLEVTSLLSASVTVAKYLSNQHKGSKDWAGEVVQ